MHIESYSDYDNISLYNIPSYNFIKENRSYSKNGGVAVYILDNIKWNRRLDLENEIIECIWIGKNPEKC